MTDIILHHYSVSPFAEKVRIGLGLKQAAWKSVDIPNVMPKPDLMPLTGGYRKTPVMQVGADIYCDTQLIMLELERRLPSPPFLPKGREAEARAVTMWIDRSIFSPAVGVVMSQVADRFGEAFKKDRSEFSGRSFDPERMRAALPMVRDQTYALLSLAESMLADGRKFLLGAEPSLADCALYNPVWFIQQQLGRHGRAARPAAQDRRLVGAHEGAGRAASAPTSRRPTRSISPRRPSRRRPASTPTTRAASGPARSSASRLTTPARCR